MKDLYKRLGAFRLCIVAHCTDTEIEQFDTCLLDLRSLIAHATEMQAVMKGKPTSMAEYLKLSDAEKLRLLIPHGDTCEWKEGKDRDDWQVGCDASRIWWHSKPSMLGMKLCPYCGKRLIEKPLALTETPRPATTGEGMGEK